MQFGSRNLELAMWQSQWKGRVRIFCKYFVHITQVLGVILLVRGKLLANFLQHWHSKEFQYRHYIYIVQSRVTYMKLELCYSVFLIFSPGLSLSFEFQQGRLDYTKACFSLVLFIPWTGIRKYVEIPLNYPVFLQS